MEQPIETLGGGFFGFGTEDDFDGAWISHGGTPANARKAARAVPTRRRRAGILAAGRWLRIDECQCAAAARLLDEKRRRMLEQFTQPLHESGRAGAVDDAVVERR